MHMSFAEENAESDEKRFRRSECVRRAWLNCFALSPPPLLLPVVLRWKGSFQIWRPQYFRIFFTPSPFVRNLELIYTNSNNLPYNVRFSMTPTMRKSYLGAPKRRARFENKDWNERSPQQSHRGVILGNLSWVRRQIQIQFTKLWRAEFTEAWIRYCGLGRGKCCVGSCMMWDWANRFPLSTASASVTVLGTDKSVPWFYSTKLPFWIRHNMRCDNIRYPLCWTFVEGSCEWRNEKRLKMAWVNKPRPSIYYFVLAQIRVLLLRRW